MSGADPRFDVRGGGTKFGKGSGQSPGRGPWEAKPPGNSWIF